MTKIAIIIPSFNNEDTISDTLESVQSQNGWLSKIFTVLLADDCSRDHTVELAEKFLSSSIPLQIFQGDQNVGQWNNVNRAIDLIKETVDWFLILHSDDIAKPNWLEMMVSKIESCSENVGSICSDWDNLMPDGTIKRGEDNPNKNITVMEGNDEKVRETLHTGCWWHISGCAIRVKTFEDCGFFNPKFPYQADWEWLLRSLKRKWTVEFIPRTLILYRLNMVGVSSKAFQTHQDIREFIEIIPDYIYCLESKDIFDIHAKRIKFILRRIGKSFFTLNTQRVSQGFNILFMLLFSLKECEKKLKINRKSS